MTPVENIPLEDRGGGVLSHRYRSNSCTLVSTSSKEHPVGSLLPQASAARGWDDSTGGAAPFHVVP